MKTNQEILKKESPRHQRISYSGTAFVLFEKF